MGLGLIHRAQSHSVTLWLSELRQIRCIQFAWLQIERRQYPLRSCTRLGQLLKHLQCESGAHAVAARPLSGKPSRAEGGALAQRWPLVLAGDPPLTIFPVGGAEATRVGVIEAAALHEMGFATRGFCFLRLAMTCRTSQLLCRGAGVERTAAKLMKLPPQRLSGGGERSCPALRRLYRQVHGRWRSDLFRLPKRAGEGRRARGAHRPRDPRRRRAWQQTREEGHGQVVFINGEPGIGKSALIDTLRREVRAEGLTRITFRCSHARLKTTEDPRPLTREECIVEATMRNTK
jgi:hypothetical protein